MVVNMSIEELNELALLEHNKEGWEQFALQKCEQCKQLEELCRKYRNILERIANYEENTEDYYGGVSINYGAMVKDIVKLASDALTK